MERGLKSLPLFYGGTLFVNLFSIIHDGPKFFYLDTISWWVSAIVATIISLIGGVLTWIFLVPYQKKAIDKSLALQASLQKGMYGCLYCHNLFIRMFMTRSRYKNI